MVRVVLVRHGETDWNREGRLQGWAPVPLNETGREQAAAAGEYLAGEYDVDAVYTSDLLRAEQTTELLLDTAGATGVPVTAELAWRERHLGVYQGLTYDDAEERFPRFGLSESAYEAAAATPESGESLRDVADRVTTRFEEVVDARDGGTVLVVSHGGPIHVVLGHVKGMDLPDALTNHHQANCAVNEIVFDGEGIEVVHENVTAWQK